jgi:hypothetical protein
MTILEALQKSNKIKRSHWISYIIFKEHSIFTENNDPYIVPASNIVATDWEPVIEKKKLYNVLCHYPGACGYHKSSLYFENEEQAKKYFKDKFIKLLPHTEIEV